LKSYAVGWAGSQVKRTSQGRHCTGQKQAHARTKGF